MADPLGGVFRKPFAEQVAAFRLRLGNLVPTARWNDIQRSAHDRAFMVAGAMKADLLVDLGLAVDKAIADGTTLETFRADFRGIVTKHGWHGWTGEGTKRGEAWRTRIIYKTNAATTYAAGRMAQLVQGGFKYWVYRHGASLEPRIQHLGWDGLILSPDHPFWVTHAPPNGWGCSCYVIGARSKAGASRVGGKPSLKLPPDWQKLDPKTGAQQGIDRGWDYSPGASVTETVSVAAQKIAQLPVGLGSPLGDSLAQLIDRAWSTWVADTLVGGSRSPALVGVIRQTELRAMAARGLTPGSAEIMVRPGLLSGPKVNRDLATGNALTERAWMLLPQAIRQPLAVLLDTKTGKFIYLLPGESGNIQLAVELDYLLKNRRDVGITNMIVSAYVPALAKIRRGIAAQQLIVISGGLG